MGCVPAGHGRVLDIPVVVLPEAEPSGLVVLLVGGLEEWVEDVLEPAVAPGVLSGVVVVLLALPEGEVVLFVEGLVALVPGMGSHPTARFGVVVCGAGVAVLAGGVAVCGVGDAVCAGGVAV